MPELTTHRRRAAVALLAGCLTMVAGSASAGSRTESAARGAAWIASQQESNGAFFTSKQRADETAEMLASAAAGGVDDETVERAITYIRKNGKEAATRGGKTGRIVAGLVAAGEDPRSFGGVDYMELLRSQSSGGAHDPSQFFDNLLAANGALAGGDDLTAENLAYLESNECAGGGFGFDNECASGADVDSSAMAIGVFVAAGESAEAMVGRARSYILSQQKSDGGFGFTANVATSADSTGLVLSALAALKESALSGDWSQPDGDDPVEALAALQHSSGGFRFGRTASKPNGQSTKNAIPGMAGDAYPIPARRADAAGPTATPSGEQAAGEQAAGDPTATPEGGAGSVEFYPAPARTSTPSPTGSAAVTPEATTASDENRAPAPFAQGATDVDADPERSIFASPLLWIGVVTGGAGLALIGRALYQQLR